jgi:hypothetical protein
MGYFSAINKNEILSFAAKWMEVVKYNKPDTERQVPHCSLSYMET